MVRKRKGRENICSTAREMEVFTCISITEESRCGRRESVRSENARDLPPREEER